MKFDIYENSSKVKQLSFFEFIDFYYNEFGEDCGNPAAIAKSLQYNETSYIGKGYTVTKTRLKEKAPTSDACAHRRKYLNKISNALQFYVCPDCKKEV